MLRQPNTAVHLREATGSAYGGRCRADYPGLPAISKVAALYLAQENLQFADVMARLRRGNLAPAFLADLESLRGRGNPAGVALLVNYSRGDTAMLHVSQRDFSYCEMRGRDARLLIPGERLTATCCAHLTGGGYRLSQIMDDASLPFYVAADPLVISVDTKDSGLGSGLTFWLKVDRCVENWRLVPGNPLRPAP